MSNTIHTPAYVAPAIRAEIRERAASLSSEREVAAAIFATIRAHGLPLQQVTLEQMKILVVDAVRAFRASRNEQEVAA